MKDEDDEDLQNLQRMRANPQKSTKVHKSPQKFSGNDATRCGGKQGG